MSASLRRVRSDLMSGTHGPERAQLFMAIQLDYMAFLREHDSILDSNPELRQEFEKRFGESSGSSHLERALAIWGLILLEDLPLITKRAAQNAVALPSDLNTVRRVDEHHWYVADKQAYLAFRIAAYLIRHRGRRDYFRQRFGMLYRMINEQRKLEAH